MNDSVRILHGTVLDGTGQPVAQARVHIASAPGPVPDLAALTGADGRFTLTAPKPGTYEIACDTDMHGSARVRVEVGARGAVAALRIVLRA